MPVTPTAFRTLTIAAGVLLATSCDQGKKRTGRTYTDDEIAKLEAYVMTAIEQNAARECPRPPLRDTQSSASVRDSQLALVEPTGDTAACLARFAKLRHASKVDVRTNLAAVLDVADPSVIDADAACNYDVEAFVVTATSAGAACSPYQTGVHEFPVEIHHPGKGRLMLLDVAHAVGVRARIRASNGDPKGGLVHAADGVRLFQDIARGHTSMLAFMTVRGAERLLLSYADAIIEQLSPADAAELVPMFDVLLATEPHIGPALQGEAEHVALHAGLARVKPESWHVPGGASDLTVRGTGAREDRDIGAEVMRESFEEGERDDRACPARASHAACRQGLVEIGPSVLMRPLEPAYLADLAGDLAATTARLAATRIALEVRREARCPTAEDLASPRYTALLSPAVLGDSLRATVDGKTLRLAPPAWPGTKSVSWTIQCP